MPRHSAVLRFLSSVLLLPSILSLAAAQVHEQHPYRQRILKTRVKVKSSRDKQASYRYSTWGHLSSSDRRYTQKVCLHITVTNLSATAMERLRVEYRIYQRDLARGHYAVAASGDIVVPHMARGQTQTVLTDEATCQYRLRWNSLVRGNRLSRSGEKYAGYVVIYHDRKGPVTWDMSSDEMYEEYAKELRKAREASQATSSSSKPSFSPSVSGKSPPLPYSDEATVYLSKTGRKFHRKNCRYVRGGARPIPRGDALKSGHTPCSVCKP